MDTNNAAASANVDVYLYLPDTGWVLFMCIPRARLGKLCLVPVKWLQFVCSYAYGADGDIFSGINDDEIMTDAGSEEEEEEPVAEGHDKPEEDTPKIPVDQETILGPATPLEQIPATCYFWSIDAPRVMDLEMITDRKTTKSISSTDPGFVNRESWVSFSVKDRDGDTCVFHASVLKEVSRVSVQACHIFPHAKGDAYVKSLECYHEVPEEDCMNTVETPLNVVCIKDTFHTYLAKAYASILPVRRLEQAGIALTARTGSEPLPFQGGRGLHSKATLL
ncbi:hypothetical protein B0H19DRAFT_466340 [Mycena capillaripes]|nr:hypothetical protein B0H19DRAFT_466340 [Mycena capillaripes]